MKKTAVEWLRQELLKRDMDISIKDLFEQAKEMEKQQMEKLKDFDTWKEWKNTGIIKSE
jgi:hypothetical protein